MIQLTDSEAIGVPASTVQYSTVSPFNCDGTKMLVLERANFAMYDLTAMKRLESLPTLGDSNEPLWSNSDPLEFYSHAGNILYITCYGSGTKPFHQFQEYASISGLGETDLSEDGDHLALCGAKPDGSREIFVYTISSGTKGKVRGAPVALDSIYITPENDVLTSDQTGMTLYDADMRFIRKIANANGHKAVTRDANGDQCLIWTNSNENPVTLPNFPNGIVKIRLADGQQTGLLSLPWNLACHISAPRKGGFAIVSTYGVNRAGGILQFPLDGTAAKSLGQHGSDSSAYDGQPLASVSHDGKLVAWNSNAKGLTDVYLETLDPSPTEKPISSQIVYQDARGGGNLSVATFKDGLLVENENLP